MSETEMTAGRQFIAGRRVASGEATLLSLKAADGEATGHRFYPASREEAALAAQAAAQAFAAYSGTSPETRARFLETIADELDGLGESFFAIAHAETALPLARLQGERARTSGQLRMFAGLLRRGDVLGRALIRRCRRVNPYRERICASIRWRLARLRYSAPATFRWPFLPPAAIPPRRWRPVARWWLRLIPDIWQPQSRRRRPLCGRWRNAPCPAGCST
jgi:hypothetical protein